MLTATGLRRSELGPRGRKLVRHKGKQVLVIAEQGRLFAIGNRCPHEGYPLSEGTIGPGCVLTCNWHNWKFDLTRARLRAEQVKRLRKKLDALVVEAMRFSAAQINARSAWFRMQKAGEEAAQLFPIDLQTSHGRLARTLSPSNLHHMAESEINRLGLRPISEGGLRAR